ncbi:helix-turn-helix domain-containing protein [Chitinibacter fontanus]|uniref:Helix-turn-helix domain-containing protein n=1 Tax=Chitinibacter fontanus TaxID=1737446 RepID=A0A7D5ZGQ5_9NEIS|nr:RodZ domain-containing protein [Chitinibacter fontanus]QLI82784.1 helix-turn-helix domain-containing protein [Chitinibacter fontanus]
MIEEQENKPVASPSFLPAGRQLRAAREALGLTVEDVAGQLKLSRRQVQALEQEAFDELPSNLFIRGFVRNYARLVQIDPAPLIDYLANVLPGEAAQESPSSVSIEVGQSFPEMRSSTRSSSSTLIVVVALLGVFLGVGGVYWYLQQPSTPEVALPELNAPEAIPASAASEAATEVASSAVVATAQPQTSASVASKVEVTAAPLVSPIAASVVAGAAELSVVTESDSWVQIVDSTGSKVLSEIVRPGYERKVTGVAPFSVKVGNAPKTKLTIQGRPVDLSSYLKPGSDVVNLELK